MLTCDLATLTTVQASGDPDQLAELLQTCTEALTDPSLWYWAIAFTVVCAVVGGLIGKYKNAIVRDTLLGLALGPIGWLVSLLLPAIKPKRRCPACGKPVDVTDKHCRNCGALL
jgi:zinc-ribbon domain